MSKINKIKTKGFHLCHLNVAPAQAPIHDPIMASFVEQLDTINQLAYESPGFIWHLQIDINNPADLALYGEKGMLFNLSVWESIEALWNYTYNSKHCLVMENRRQWFKETDGHNYVLWWKKAGERPSLEEAKVRLNHLNTHGVTEHAFIFERIKNPQKALLNKELRQENLVN